MKTGKISVIVPVYNTERFLRKCVDSILRQSYADLEIILVDDGSDMDAYMLCDELAGEDSRIIVIHQDNLGLSAARNRGLKIASGQYIAFVDSDDYISSTMYEELLSISSPASIAVSHFVRVDDMGNIYDRDDPFLTSETIDVEEYIESLLLHKGDVSVCTKLFDRDIIGDIRFVEGKTNEDLLFMLQIVRRIHKVSFTKKIGYYYYVRSGSLSSGYGQSVIDMVNNSIIVKANVVKYWPKLIEQSWRFAIYQHMAYLLLYPLKNKDNDLVYSKALHFIRHNFLKHTIPNKYLQIKHKIIILGIIICPNMMAYVYQKKNDLL